LLGAFWSGAAQGIEDAIRVIMAGFIVLHLDAKATSGHRMIRVSPDALENPVFDFEQH
jgi:hypothetical protein